MFWPGFKEPPNLSIPLGDQSTNNIAEYLGLIYGLRLALAFHNRLNLAKGGDFDLDAEGDSELIVKQMNREYTVNDPKLRILYTIATGLARRIEARSECDCQVGFSWIPRDENVQADALARQAAQVESFKGCSTVYYPTLCNYSWVCIDGGVETVASNDYGTARPSGLFFIDAQFLSTLPNGENDLAELREIAMCKDSPYLSILIAAGCSMNVLGVVSRPVPMRIFYDGHARSVASNVCVEELIVVLDLPVPLHVSARHPSAYVGPYQCCGAPTIRSMLPAQYASHPYYKTDVVMLPF